MGEVHDRIDVFLLFLFFSPGGRPSPLPFFFLSFPYMLRDDTQRLYLPNSSKNNVYMV